VPGHADNHRAAAASGHDEAISELVVTSQRREEPRLLHAGNIDRLDSATIADVQHQHMRELLTRVAAAWLTRASGQEHLTAIRSPVLTGGDSCGAFLFLENGIPTRPVGFCSAIARCRPIRDAKARQRLP